MIERGEVVAAGNGSVDVRIEPDDPAKCAGCNACSTVGPEALMISDAANDVSAAVGDLVEVEIPPGTDLRAGLVVYVMPVAALLVGYGIGRTAAPWLGWDPDGTGAVTAISGVVVGMMLVRSRAHRMLSSDRFRPRVRAIIARGREAGPGTPGHSG
jgi:positive regulator of sigma E activity